MRDVWIEREREHWEAVEYKVETTKKDANRENFMKEKLQQQTPIPILARLGAPTSVVSRLPSDIKVSLLPKKSNII